MAKAQFFTIDATVALVIIGLGVVVLFTLFSSNQSKHQNALYSADLSDFFQNTRLADEPDLVNLWCTGGSACTAPTHELSNPESSLASAITQLVRQNMTEIASSLARNVTANLTQQQYGWRLALTLPNGTNVSVTEKQGIGEKESVWTTKSVVYFMNDSYVYDQTGQSVALEGPFVMQVDVWD